MARVAIFESDEDTLEGLSEALSLAGHDPVRMRLDGDSVDELARFLAAHAPNVAVYNVTPPYARTLQRWRDLCQRPEASCTFLLTTTWPKLDVGKHECSLIVVLTKPYTFDEVLAGIAKACGSS